MNRDLVVVTAASSNHFGALVQMLTSLRDLDARVECYDIGLTAGEAAALPRWPRAVHRTFDYAAHPAHMHVSVNAGEYAWKPVIVADVIDRVRTSREPCDVLWADAGCYFESLDVIAARIAATGLWVRRSAGTMREWTHPGMFEWLRADPALYSDQINADATLVGFAVDSASPAAAERLYQGVVVPWRDCAMVKDCIAPPGSSRKNHRQDQAVLSYLVHREGYTFAEDTPTALRVRTKCDRWFYHYVGFDVPRRLYAYTCLS
jgi:Protein of unknown function (DUF1647)